MIWFASDHHINHANIRQYTERHKYFTDLDEMNEALIANHNSVVTEDDIVYFVGDFAMGKIVESLPYAARFNGRKILILGNHDRPWPGNKPTQISHWLPEYEKYFEVKFHDYIEINGQNCEIVHLPVTGDSHDSDRYSQFRPEDRGEWTIHGHVHSPEIAIAPRHLHVGIDSDWTQYGVDRYHPIPLAALEAAIGDVHE